VQVGQLPQVANDRTDFGTRVPLPDPVGGRFCLGGVPSVQEYGVSPSGQVSGRFETNASGCSGNEYGLLSQEMMFLLVMNVAWWLGLGLFIQAGQLFFYPPELFPASGHQLPRPRNAGVQLVYVRRYFLQLLQESFELGDGFGVGHDGKLKFTVLPPAVPDYRDRR
jgi:hypothetical protein